MHVKPIVRIHSLETCHADKFPTATPTPMPLSELISPNLLNRRVNNIVDNSNHMLVFWTFF